MLLYFVVSEDAQTERLVFLEGVVSNEMPAVVLMIPATVHIHIKGPATRIRLLVF